MLNNSSRVIGLRIEDADFDPKRRFRFVYGGFEEDAYVLRDLFDIKIHEDAPNSSQSPDESFYLIPLCTTEYTIAVRHSDGRDTLDNVEPGFGAHISLHGSGQVNIHSKRSSKGPEGRRPYTKMRGRRARLVDDNPVITAVFNAVDLFPPVSPEEFNRRDGSEFDQVMVDGLYPPALHPLCVSIYRVTNNAGWQLPLQSNTVQMHYAMGVRGKPSTFHFSIWQNTEMERRPGVVAFYFQ